MWAAAPMRRNGVIDMLFATPQQRDRIAKDYGAIEGGHQTLQRLADQLAGT